MMRGALLLTLLLLCLPFTAQAQKYLYASTKEEWKALAENSKYSNTEVYVTLTGDFTIDNDVDNWEDFKGTLDGNGHTITVDYKGIDRAPLRNTVGDSYVKNLRIEGTIENHLGLISYDWANPLARYVGKGTLKVTNCHSRVHYKITDCASYSCVCNGGFVGKTEGDGSVIFENCSYIGSIKTNEDNPGDGSIGNYNGGMIGVHDGKDLKIHNCFSYIDAEATAPTKESKVGPFVGELYPSSTTYEYDNNYSYVSNYVNKEYKIGEIIEIIDGWWKQYARLSSGEIAYKFNKGKTDDDVIWLQTIGKDQLPTTRLVSPQSKKVYYTDASNRENYGQWVTLLHPLNVTLPEGAKVYVVADIDEANKKVKLCKFNAESYAQTPIVVYCPNGIGTLELPNGYYNRVEQDGILTGNYDAHSAQTGDYVLEGDKFVPATGTIPAGYCYLRGGTADAYTIDTTSVADDVFVISSKSAWNIFKSQYSGKEVNAYLTCDLTLTADDEAMESFKGTFDGQGHSIIYDFVTSEDTGKDKKIYGLFYKASGTIKNLNITGKIQVDAHITYALSYPAPLAFETHGSSAAPDELNIENCHSDVSYYTGGNSTYTGAGFILSPIYSTINFKDCSYTGTFASPHHKFAGGFVAQHWSSATINLTNCFSDVHIPSTSVIDNDGDYSPQSVGYFIGKQKGGALTLNNCYAHNSSTLSFGTTLDGQTIVSDSLLKIGEVTYKLQAARTGDDNPWAQTIGTDSEPQLQTFSPESNEVFHADETKIARDYDHVWTTLCYPADVADLHEEIKQLVASRIENDTLYANVILSNTIPDNTPVLLYSTGKYGMPPITLPACYYNKLEQTGIITGVYDETAANDNMRMLTYGDETTFSKGTTAVPAFRCYLNANDHDAYKIANEVVLISSKEEWNLFKTLCNNFEVNARLTTDLTLETTDEGMGRFKGTFDGQGHTLTLNYTGNKTGESSYVAPFIMAEGTIKNLKITGELMEENHKSSLDVNSMLKAPLVIWPIGTLNIENCHSNVAFKRAEWQQSTTKCLTGFVMYNNSGSTLNFKDCSFTGSSEMNSVLQSGGFVANQYDNNENTLTFTNCYSDLTGFKMNAPADDLACDYFVGKLGANTTVSFTNSYARKATLAEGKEVTNVLDVPVITDSQAASGEVAYKLNAGRSGGDAPWRQNVGTDALPQLKLFSPDSKEVYIAADTVKIGTAGWSTHYYPLAEALPEGVRAYTVSGVGNESDEYIVNLEEVTGTIPAYTPVLLCTLGDGETEASQTITIEMPDLYYNELKETDIEDNGQAFQLVGVTRDTETFDGCYVLQRHTDAATGKKKTAFYRVDTSVATPTIPAWKCFLVYTGKASEGDANTVHLRLDGEATGINGAVNAINGILSEGQTYDLNGRPVKTLQKGQVYIKNGQKFVIK